MWPWTHYPVYASISTMGDKRVRPDGEALWSRGVTLHQESARTRCLVLFHFLLILCIWGKSLKHSGPQFPPLQNEASTLDDLKRSLFCDLPCLLAGWAGGPPTFLTNWRSCHFTCQQGLFILSSSFGSQGISSSFKKQAMPLWEYLSCIWVKMGYNTILCTSVFYLCLFTS